MHQAWHIIVIDDHPLFRKGVGQLLQLDQRFHLVSDVASGEEGLALAREHAPDLVVLDLNMKGMDGIATLKALKELDNEIKVVLLTVSDHSNDLVAAVRNRADGYLLKEMEPEEITQRLAEVMEGQIAIPERLSRALVLALRKDDATENTQRLATLTEREREILACLAAGLPNKLIGRELDIAEGTVKVHVKSLLRKMHLRSRLEAAVWAVEQGIKR